MKTVYELCANSAGYHFALGIFSNESDAEKALSFAKNTEGYAESNKWLYIKKRKIYDSFEEYKKDVLEGE